MTLDARWTPLVTLVATSAACGDDTPPPPVDADAGSVNGCPRLVAPLAAAGDPIDGDTYESFALPQIFTMYCVRCHGTAQTGAARNGAPVGFNWDDPASVRAHLPEMRAAIGVNNIMPPGPPTPSCDERRRLVRWIDANAP